VIEPIDPPALPASSGNYTHGTLVTHPGRTVFVSGQVAWAPAPPDFEAQCRTVWSNVFTVLASAGMGPGNLAKVTTYLADRRYREANSRIRAEVLGDHRPALTIVICDIYAEEWLLEIEAIAVA
jgi:enamine deaminase RidA (YjgF/YER057c/UK114 family)